MGLADEIMDMVDRMLLMQRDGHVVASTATGLTLRSRLTAIEQELEGYRTAAEVVAMVKSFEQSAATWEEDIERLCPKITQASALPCSSEYVNAQTGYDREDGG